MTGIAIIPARNIKVGDRIINRHRGYLVWNVETITVDSRGESWDDFEQVFVTLANGHVEQYDPDRRVQIYPRPACTCDSPNLIGDVHTRQCAIVTYIKNMKMVSA